MMTRRTINSTKTWTKSEGNLSSCVHSSVFSPTSERGRKALDSAFEGQRNGLLHRPVGGGCPGVCRGAVGVPGQGLRYLKRCGWHKGVGRQDRRQSRAEVCPPACPPGLPPRVLGCSASLSHLELPGRRRSGATWSQALQECQTCPRPRCPTSSGSARGARLSSASRVAWTLGRKRGQPGPRPAPWG